MACGCDKVYIEGGGALVLRCIAPDGCNLNPWGWRSQGETYTLQGELACVLADAYPSMFECVVGEPAAEEVSNGK